MMGFKKKSTVLTTILLFMMFIMAFFAVRGALVSIFDNKFLIAPSFKKSDVFLKRNIVDLSFVVEELIDMNYETVSIPHLSLYQEEYYMEVKTGPGYLDRKKMPIPDELIDPVKALYKNGVQSIFGSQEFVDFTIWSNMNESRGIIYSYIGSAPEGEQFIEIECLSNDKWYYYIHNYDKAKSLNPEAFK